jgi:hypothetical protein
VGATISENVLFNVKAGGMHRNHCALWSKYQVAEFGTVRGGHTKKLATATQPHFPKKIADFRQATGFQISRYTLRKLMFDPLTSSEAGVFVRQSGAFILCSVSFIV